MSAIIEEMTTVPTNKAFLEVCMSIEGLCADLYHYYSERYRDVPEASRLWKKTALEEENHQRQFELALLLSEQVEYDVTRVSLKRAYSIESALQKFVAQVKRNTPDLLTAVSRAVEMEEILSELHANQCLRFKDDSIQGLFKAMNEADNEHMVALQRYLTILNLPQCEMCG